MTLAVGGVKHKFTDTCPEEREKGQNCLVNKKEIFVSDQQWASKHGFKLSLATSSKAEISRLKLN